MMNKNMTRLLSAIETIGEQYGMKLNHPKRELMFFLGMATVKVRNGDEVQKQRAAKYLGCLLNDKTAARNEVLYIMTQATAAWKKNGCILEALPQ